MNFIFCFWIHIYLAYGCLFSSKIYDKRDDFDFDIVNFLSFDSDVFRSTFYGGLHLSRYLFA